MSSIDRIAIRLSLGFAVLAFGCLVVTVGGALVGRVSAGDPGRIHDLELVRRAGRLAMGVQRPPVRVGRSPWP